MKARVVNGTSEAGRLEIFYNGKWATVCGWGFVKNEAQVACKMLGYNRCVFIFLFDNKVFETTRYYEFNISQFL